MLCTILDDAPRKLFVAGEFENATVEHTLKIMQESNNLLIIILIQFLPGYANNYDLVEPKVL